MTETYDRALAALGPELSVLGAVPVEDIALLHPLMSEAVTRLRSGAVIRQAGYDGEYGVIRLFEDGELDRFAKGDLLFDAPRHRRVRPPRPPAETATPVEPAPTSVVAVPIPSGRTGLLAGLDADQARAAVVTDGPVMVIAGPGSGKTRMLTYRIAHLVRERGVPAAACLAVTFTRKATEEMRSRLAALLPGAGQQVAVHSFHSLGLTILRAHGDLVGLAPDFRVAGETERKAALAEALGVGQSRAAGLLKAISVLKRTGSAGSSEESQALAVLGRIGREQNWVDFDDLVALAVQLLDEHTEIAALWQARFSPCYGR